MRALDRFVQVVECWPNWLALMVIIIYWLVGYEVPNHINLLGITPAAPEIWIDRAIPFVPWTIFVYQSVFVLTAWGISWILYEDHGRGFVAGFLAVTVHSLFFVFLPTHYPRIGLDPSWWCDFAFSVNWFLDADTNCFPSMHVSVAFLISFIIKERHRVAGRWFVVWSVVVSISTLTTRQHYIIDVVVGIAIAFVIFRLVFKHWPKL